ncbi:MAG: sigma-70 family RNA polymerase sigma factor [Chloroflexi bacterium]|nr:sigma-70 family RNA polymerase sigma factor [Chloroflexota bacterium]
MELTDTYPGTYLGDESDGAATTRREKAASFADLYARSRDDVYRAVLLTVRDQHRAEDAVQEAFARAYADWDRIRVHPNPVGWVARVALNHATSLWRRLRRESTEPPPTTVAPADERPIDPLLIRAVWRLPRRQRQVVALRILLDQSIDQTAQSLGMAPGTVRAHLHRALRTLHEQIGDAGHDTEESDHG